MRRWAEDVRVREKKRAGKGMGKGGKGGRQEHDGEMGGAECHGLI